MIEEAGCNASAAISRIGMCAWGLSAISSRPSSELSNLGVFLESRYIRLGVAEDLEQIIKQAKEALAAIPADHRDRPGLLHNLAGALHSRYNRLGALEHLEQAIRWAKEALKMISPDHPVRGIMLQNLGHFLQDRYKRLGALQDLEQAINRAEVALEAAPSGGAPHERADRLGNLGNRLFYRYERFGALADLQQAITWAEQALAATPLDGSDRAGRLNNLGNFLEDRYTRPGAVEDLELSISQAEAALDATPLGHISRGGMLSNLGVRFHLKYDCSGAVADLEKAVSLAERALEATPADHDHPDRPARLNNLGAAFKDRYDLLGALQDRQQAIRQAEAATEATPPNRLNCAGILTNLGQGLLQMDSVTEFERGIDTAWHSELSPPRSASMQLGPPPSLSHSSGGGRKRRCCWRGPSNCSRGGPLHRVDTQHAGPRCLVDIPTIKALSYTREKPLTLLRSDSRLLLVTMPTTPGNKALANAAQEADNIGSILGDRAARLNRPSAAQVLENPSSYHAIYFACHGVSDLNNPSGSHLLLLKADGTLDHLTVRAITSTSLKHAQLAYLSACCAATNADESIYIASAFQLAGFSHVLATLWESNDDACRRVAADFYSLLFGSHGNEVGVARAFGHAVHRLREQNRAQPLKWASFMHTGA